ncbi:MAG TPA: hypothetical protein VKL99_07555 [Candidatus Angelobacter sp.]|nr:hypothetical protein [Candidatus Angelobacter sp.]
MPLLHHRAANDILRFFRRETSLADFHCDLGPMVHTMQYYLRQHFTIGDGYGTKRSRPF